MICLKPCPPPHSASNEPIPGLLGMSFSMFSLDDLFYVFLQLVSISLRSWNADDRGDVIVIIVLTVIITIIMIMM